MSQLVVGSLTTLPKRLIHLHDTLKSIQTQTRPLDKLYLNIPYETRKGEKYVIPSDLLDDIPYSERVIFNRCKDYGSITKILPTLLEEQDPETIIISFDDDMIYDVNVVQSLYDGVKMYNTCVGMSGWVVGKFPFLYQSVHDTDREVDWLEGKTAVAYPRKFLPSISKNITDLTELMPNPFPKELGQHDDHIITYHIAKIGAKRIVVDGRSNQTEKMDIRRLDSISGNPFKYLSQVSKIVKVMKKEGLYTQEVDTTQTYGFKIIIVIIIIIIILILLTMYFRKR